jgi:hypothetical protein
MPAQDRVWGNQQMQPLAPGFRYHAEQGRQECPVRPVRLRAARLLPLQDGELVAQDQDLCGLHVSSRRASRSQTASRVVRHRVSGPIGLPARHQGSFQLCLGRAAAVSVTCGGSSMPGRSLPVRRARTGTVAWSPGSGSIRAAWDAQSGRGVLCRAVIGVQGGSRSKRQGWTRPAGRDGAPLADVTAVRGTPCAFAPGVAVALAPLPQAGRGEPRCRRGTFYLCEIRVRDVARRAG